MPDSEDRRNKVRRRKRRATGYIIAGLIIMAAIILSPNLAWLSASVGVELWWLWAISTDQGLSRLTPVMGQRTPHQRGPENNWAIPLGCAAVIALMVIWLIFGNLS